MPMVPLKLIAGVQTELTETLNTSGISQSNLIRFESGLPQKIGGWTKFFSSTITALARCLHAWQDIANVKHLAFGTSLQLGVITNNALQDITPQTTKTDGTPDFSTTINTKTIAVVDNNI